MFGLHSGNGYVEMIEGIRIKTINYGRDTLMSEFMLKKGSTLTAHSHSYEQTGYLVEGKIKLFIGTSSRELSPGDSWNVPSGQTHKAEIIEDSIAIEIFCPCREDYLKFVNREDIET